MWRQKVSFSWIYDNAYHISCFLLELTFWFRIWISILQLCIYRESCSFFKFLFFLLKCFCDANSCFHYCYIVYVLSGTWRFKVILSFPYLHETLSEIQERRRQTFWYWGIHAEVRFFKKSEYLLIVRLTSSVLCFCVCVCMVQILKPNSIWTFN